MYSAQITRRRKGAIVLLIDRSGSMDESVSFNGETTTKAKAVASTANRLIDEIINRSHRDDGIHDYFDIAVVGYSDDKVDSLLGEGFEKTTALAARPVRMEKYFVRRTLPSGEWFDSVLERKCWIEPAAKGNTPMYAALHYAHLLTAKWRKRHKSSFPPIVINITDGEANDADEKTITDEAAALKSSATDDGNTLLFNIHIATEYDTESKSIKYPSLDEEMVDNRYTKMLYDISSIFPECYNEAIARLKGAKSRPPYRAMCYNCTADELIGVMDIGSTSIDKIL